MAKNLDILSPSAAAKHASELDKSVKKAEKAKILLQASCTHSAPAGERQYTHTSGNGSKAICSACKAEIDFSTFKDDAEFNRCVEYVINVLNVDKIILAQNVVHIKDKDSEKILETAIDACIALRQIQKTHGWVVKAHSEKATRKKFNGERSEVSWGGSRNKNVY